MKIVKMFLSKSAMPNKRPAGLMLPSQGFGRHSLGFRLSKSIPHSLLRTCSNFDNAEFVFFYVGGPQCHFITSVAFTVRIRTLSAYYHKLKFSLLRFSQFKVSHSMCGPQ